MKVGLVCPYDLASAGGVQQLVRELADRLRRLGEDVTLVAAGEPGEGDDDTILVGRSSAVPANRSRAPVTLIPAAWSRVRRALAGVDVIHLHEPLVPLVGWAALGVDKPLVATFHADAPKWARTVYRWSPRVGARLRRSVTTAVSDVAAAAVPDRWGEVSIVPNAIDVASYDLPVARVERRVAFLGRDDPRKGLDILLGSWPAIRKACGEAELVVIGARRPGTVPGVTFHGPVPDRRKKELLASSAVLVAPNTGGESFGMVVAEGMAAGCAVVVSDLAAFRAVVGDAARTFPTGDGAALAGAVLEMLTEPEAAAELGARARARARHYDWAGVTSAYRARYEKAID